MSFCPICQSILTQEKISINTIEYRCLFDIENHFYCARKSCEDRLLKQKIRLKEGEHNLIMVIDYDQNICEVWRNDDKQKICVPGAFETDWSDLNKIKQKIKTYLLFG